MKERLKKIFKMSEKDVLVEEQETAGVSVEMHENGSENANPTAEMKQQSGDAAKTEELQKQLAEVRNKYLYLFSDFENFKRNAAKERIEMMQTAGRDIMSALLPVLDDFDRAAKSSGGLSEGMSLIHQKLVNTLKSKGLTCRELKPGDTFDTDWQEAVAEIPAASEEMNGKIVDVLEPGYFLGEKIIRYAKVVVGK